METVGKNLGLNFRVFLFVCLFLLFQHHFLYTVFIIRLLKDDHPHVRPLILTESDRNKGNDWQCRSIFPVQKKYLADIWKVVKKFSLKISSLQIIVVYTSRIVIILFLFVDGKQSRVTRFRPTLMI